ncbi:MAG: aminopeptidase N [Beijerinckiaceae bacterium]|nr:aminopeptidase N [Beijerinckiaceae bacterium]
MRTEQAQPIRLADYRPPNFLIDTVNLTAKLDGAQTRVIAELAIRPNPQGEPGAPLMLDGDELKLVSLQMNGAALPADSYVVSPHGLTLTQPPRAPFTLTIETALDPAANSKLMGLYRSSGAYCTQCEAEGFRRITYFIDRPDVMSVYTTRIEADKNDAPVLLGNGNPVEQGDLPNGRHYAVWHDPHPKPAYLFALVGGRLDRVGGEFVTRSGRTVELGIFVEPGKADRAHYALDALKRSMRWDEEAFGCEYDLDVFNIVAVADFNMGAMENKGLNIFNDKYVLASPETATDADYANIEAIIAHEYFHNWTGNRITCRDWFQLCLKEGLTVFRDQEFTSDQRSRPVKRIADVRNLRSLQFAEDSGPLAHPVRPQVYREINNFYTPTVYEKGAELVRMIKTLLGPTDFRAGMDLYLQRCDGTASTIEEFLACFADVSGHDLTHFALWYEQAGTPKLSVTDHYDPATKTYRLDFSQVTPPTPGQPSKKPVVIPVLLGLVCKTGDLPLHADGINAQRGLFVCDTASSTITFQNIAERPVPSLLRGFSAPVRLDFTLGKKDLLTLFRHDSDPFNRWQAAQSYATQILVDATDALTKGASEDADSFGDPAFADAIATLIEQSQDHAFAAQILMLPSEGDIAREIGQDIDPDAIMRARRVVKRALARTITPRLDALYHALSSTAAYQPDAPDAGRRALRNGALDLLVAGDAERYARLAFQQFEQADNMTDRFAALSTLAQHKTDWREKALLSFERLTTDPLILDKWLALQASIAEPDTLNRVRALMSHSGFSLSNPNRVRSLIGAFAMSNPSQFHRADGAGYDFVAGMVLDLDRTNPQVAARILSSFRTWRSMEEGRRAHALAALKRIADTDGLSSDVADIATRSLA